MLTESGLLWIAPEFYFPPIDGCTLEMDAAGIRLNGARIDLNQGEAMTLGSGFYQYILANEIHVCLHWDQIPGEIDELIAFIPDIPEGPHTAAEHDEIDKLPKIFEEYLARCQQSPE